MGYTITKLDTGSVIVEHNNGDKYSYIENYKCILSDGFVFIGSRLDPLYSFEYTDITSLISTAGTTGAPASNDALFLELVTYFFIV